MGKPEAAVENYLRNRIRSLGGFIEKWESPGTAGLPDEVVVFRGKTTFVETKAPGEKARELQRLTMKEIRLAGGDARVIDTRDKVDAFIEELLLLPELLPDPSEPNHSLPLR